MWRVDESRVWKTSREIGAYHRFVVTEQHRAHAAFARCNEHRPENRRRDGSMNRDSAAPADASSARLGATSRSSIALHAARAIVSVRSWTDAPCGRHRLHGRNPARSASLGVARRRVECDVFAECGACGATRPTVHARRRDRKKERAVGRNIARRNRRPFGRRARITRRRATDRRCTAEISVSHLARRRRPRRGLARRRHDRAALRLCLST